jgi:SEC-C motif-containing protein
MRSRYTAFVLGNFDHIERTYAIEERGDVSRETIKAMFKSVEWVGLEIIETGLGGDADDTGMVEFIARYRKDGVLQRHHERSKFRREKGLWIYVEAESTPLAGLKIEASGSGKIGRNDPCPCGSGTKFKKCCGA